MKSKLLIATFFSAFLLVSSNVQAVNFTDNQIVDSNKTWTIKFTGKVGFDDVTKKGITVTDSKGNLVNVGVQLVRDNKTVTVTAPTGGYTVGESYILNVGSKAHSSRGKALKNEYKVHFNIKNDTSTVTFKDANLERAVRDKIEKSTGDISKDDVKKITELDVTDKGIQDISGIENLTNLQSLRVSNNKISDISALKGLTNLQQLDLYDNKISNISALQNLTNLQYLRLSKNQISDTSALKGLTNLQNLYLSHNQITDISMLDGLNKIQNLEYLHKEIATNVKAKEIISKVITEGMSDLEKELALHDYVVSNTKYDMDNYLKSTIPDDDYSAYGALVKGIAVCEGYAEAMNLLLNDVGIETMIVVGTVDTPYDHAWNIVKIEGVYYHIDATWDSVGGCNRYNYFNVSDNQISKDRKWDTSLYPKCNVYKGDNTTIVTFKDKNLEQVIRNKLNKPTGDIYKGDLQNIILLDASGKDIQDISGIENLINLRHLDLHDNKISNISPLKGLTSLQELDLFYNPILDYSPVKSYYNNLKSKDFELSDSDVVTFKDVNLEKAVRDNIDKPTGDIYKGEVKAILQLDLLGKGIQDISGIENLTNLQSLRVSNNKISDISALKGLTDLKYLYLNGNQISDINAIKGLTNLQELALADNKISDISALKGLTNLQVLTLYNNQISDTDKQLLKNALPNCRIYY